MSKLTKLIERAKATAPETPVRQSTKGDVLGGETVTWKRTKADEPQTFGLIVKVGDYCVYEAGAINGRALVLHGKVGTWSGRARMESAERFEAFLAAVDIVLLDAERSGGRG